jgi:formylglycine-generating enzyme required for sulfatase activity
VNGASQGIRPELASRAALSEGRGLFQKGRDKEYLTCDYSPAVVTCNVHARASVNQPGKHPARAAKLSIVGAPVCSLPSFTHRTVSSMRTHFSLLLVSIAFVLRAASQEAPAGFVFVEGGTFKSTKSNFHGTGVRVSPFYVGKYEVTQNEWTEVMGNNPSEFKGADLPVEMVSWYDCVDYCNQRSVKEGLRPYYTIEKNAQDPGNQNPHDDIKWIVAINAGANGYRLPTEAEWEYAAGGGQKSKSHLYSGGDDVDQVAWYWKNSGDKPLGEPWNWPAIEQNRNRTKPVGLKAPNELGLHDMSGNVREWCWDWFGDLSMSGADPRGSASGGVRVWKGGGWLGGDFCCEPSFRSNFEANSRGHDQGFRVCRGL